MVIILILTLIQTNVDNLIHSGTLDKGASVTGNLAAEIKQGATNPKLKMGVSIFDDSKNITFSLK